MPIDYKEYPPNWKAIRKRILARANNCCEECGVENHSIIKRYKNGNWAYSDYKGMQYRKEGLTRIVLTIAHLKHDKENWEVKDEELKALCQKCHLQLDIKHHVANRKYGRKHSGKQQLKLIQ